MDHVPVIGHDHELIILQIRGENNYVMRSVPIIVIQVIYVANGAMLAIQHDHTLVQIIYDPRTDNYFFEIVDYHVIKASRNGPNNSVTYIKSNGKVCIAHVSRQECDRIAKPNITIPVIDICDGLLLTRNKIYIQEDDQPWWKWIKIDYPVPGLEDQTKTLSRHVSTVNNKPYLLRVGIDGVPSYRARNIIEEGNDGPIMKWPNGAVDYVPIVKSSTDLGYSVVTLLDERGDLYQSTNLSHQDSYRFEKVNHKTARDYTYSEVTRSLIWIVDNYYRAGDLRVNDVTVAAGIAKLPGSEPWLTHDR